MSVDGEHMAAGGNVLPSLDLMEAAIRDATDAYFGEPGHDPLELPDPKAAGVERRADITSEELPDDREARLRAAMDRLGPGREGDVDAETAGLSDGYTAVVEAGQAHKIIAQLEVIFRELRRPGAARPRAIILAASPDRKIGPDERALTARVLSSENERFREEDVPENEYELARLILGRMNGFSNRRYAEFAQDGEFDMGYNYTLQGDPAPGGEAAKPEERGRFMCIGVIGNEIPAILLRIDREYYEEAGKTKYRQLDDLGKMRLIAQQLQQGGASVQEVGLVTGAAYLPSRTIAAAQVEQETGVTVRVVSYGTATLARVKKEIAVKPLSVGQLAGEARLAEQRRRAFLGEAK